jgi:gas vesicle protein
MNFLFGLALGYSIGLLIAPERGEVTRERLIDKAEDVASVPREKMEEAIRDAAATTQQRAGEIGSEVGRRAAEAAVQAVSEELLGDKGTRTA